MRVYCSEILKRFEVLENGSKNRAKLVNMFDFLLEKMGVGVCRRGGEGEGVAPPHFLKVLFKKTCIALVC